MKRLLLGSAAALLACCLTMPVLGQESPRTASHSSPTISNETIAYRGGWRRGERGYYGRGYYGGWGWGYYPSYYGYYNGYYYPYYY